jgi:hypothetical protein
VPLVALAFGSSASQLTPPGDEKAAAMGHPDRVAAPGGLARWTGGASTAMASTPAAAAATQSAPTARPTCR